MTTFLDALVTRVRVLSTMSSTVLVSFLFIGGTARAGASNDPVMEAAEQQSAPAMLRGEPETDVLTAALASVPFSTVQEQQDPRYCDLPEQPAEAEGTSDAANPFGRTRTLFDGDSEPAGDPLELEEEVEATPEAPNPFGHTETMGGQS